MSAEKIPVIEPPHDVEDFFRLVPDGVKADLLDGVIYVASPDSIRNHDLTQFLYALLKGWAKPRNAGRVFCNRVAFVLGKRNSPEPDVAFVSSSRPRI